MEEVNRETELYSENTDVQLEKVLNKFSDKCVETQFCSREKFECSDLNLNLSLSSSVTRLIDLNKDSVELDNSLSESISNDGKKELRRTKLKELHNVAPGKGSNVGVKECLEADRGLRPSPMFKISWSAVDSAERNPAFNRALAWIRAGEGPMFRNKKGIPSRRRISTFVVEASQETNVSPETIDQHAEILLHRFSEKTKQTPLLYQDQFECSDLDLGLSLCGICENFKEKPHNKPSLVTTMVNLNKDSSELGHLLSLAGSGSMPSQGEQHQRMAIKPSKAQDRLGKQGSRGDNVWKENVSKSTSELPPAEPSKMAAWAVSFAEENPALLRSLARINSKDACMCRKRLRLAY